MNESQHHRGPDEAACTSSPASGSGHRRLSIIDLATGQQPLFNEDGSVVVVFNGEIYNYQELIPELTALGHVFRTRSDTEVIVHAWEAWGEDCVERFRGMFAFALWDREAADAVPGARPARRQAAVLRAAARRHAAVRLGAEVAAGARRPEPRRSIRARSKSISRSATCPSRARSSARAQAAAGAHAGAAARRSAGRSRASYWDVRFTLDTPDHGRRRAGGAGRAAATRAVRLRMISEVPLGAFLSGGVDSSAVVAMMAGLSAEPVNTCSIAFDDPAFDESRYAQKVAERYRTRHYVERVESDDFDLIDTLAALYDEPYADSSAIPTYRVCQLARKHVTVALSGDGGDESFGGYRRYRLHLMEERMRRALPLRLRQPLFGLLGRVYPKADWAPRFAARQDDLRGAGARLGRGLLPQRVDPARRHARRGCSARVQARSSAATAPSRCSDATPRSAGTDDPLALIQYLDLKTYLVGDINTKVDRASMAHSLEVREPLMDHTAGRVAGHAAVVASRCAAAKASTC